MARGLSIAALALLVVALALGGCGSQSTDVKIAASAKEQYKATGAACTTDGTLLFPHGGGRRVIYDCLIREADPDLLYAEHISSSPFRRCYVYTGEPVDVTNFVYEILSSGQRPGASLERFRCATPPIPRGDSRP
jgi:hypothetical protein